MDPDPPAVRLPLMYRMAHYGGLKGWVAKLGDLLSSLSWAPARDHLHRTEGSREAPAQ
jgi:hypothetical protein